MNRTLLAFALLGLASCRVIVPVHCLDGPPQPDCPYYAPPAPPPPPLPAPVP